ncbi:hypothetical protein ACHAPT_012141 [Fusarium lateritium]
MVSQAFFTACMAVLMLAGSNASPCIPKSSSTDSLTISTSTATLSTATSLTTETSTEASESSTKASTTTAISTTESSTLISSTESTTLSATESTTASTTESSTASTTVSITVSTTASTSESTTAEPSATTTTSQPPSVPTYIFNPGFDASPVVKDPWELSDDLVTTGLSFDIDSTDKHDGPNSALITYGTEAGTSYIRQKLDPDAVKPDVSYQVDVRVRTSTPCNAYIMCAYDTKEIATMEQRNTQYAYGDWWHITGPCKYSQEQHDVGDLYLYLGFDCNFYARCRIDTVEFGPADVQPSVD